MPRSTQHAGAESRRSGPEGGHEAALREFCGFRAGDKGDTADIALFAYDDAGYDADRRARSPPSACRRTSDRSCTATCCGTRRRTSAP